MFEGIGELIKNEEKWKSEYITESKLILTTVIMFSFEEYIYVYMYIYTHTYLTYR